LHTDQHATIPLEMSEFDRSAPPPTLQRFIEAIAAILDLRDGRLELIFRRGRLEAWSTSGMHRPAELQAFDGAGDRLLERAA
jgi:hypothetical protein